MVKAGQNSTTSSRFPFEAFAENFQEYYKRRMCVKCFLIASAEKANMDKINIETGLITDSVCH